MLCGITYNSLMCTIIYTYYNNIVIRYFSFEFYSYRNQPKLFISYTYTYKCVCTKISRAYLTIDR